MKTRTIYDFDVVTQGWDKLTRCVDHPFVPRVGDTIETCGKFYAVKRVIHRDEDDPYKQDERMAVMVVRDFDLSPYTADEVRRRLLPSQNTIGEWYMEHDNGRMWRIDEVDEDGRILKKSFKNTRTGERKIGMAAIGEPSKTVDEMVENFFTYHLRFETDLWKTCKR